MKEINPVIVNIQLPKSFHQIETILNITSNTNKVTTPLLLNPASRQRRNDIVTDGIRITNPKSSTTINNPNETAAKRELAIANNIAMILIATGTTKVNNTAHQYPARVVKPLKST